MCICVIMFALKLSNVWTPPFEASREAKELLHTPETIALWMCQDNVEVMRLNVINLDEDNSSSLPSKEKVFTAEQSMNRS